MKNAMKNTPRFFLKKTLALATLFALTGGLSQTVRPMSAAVSAVFLCPQGHYADQTNFGVAGGNKTAAQAANTVAGTDTPERTPMQGLHHTQKVSVMKTPTRGARARPEAVRQEILGQHETADARGVDLNEALVISPSSELEVRIWTNGDVEILAGAEGDGMLRTNARIPHAAARALGAWLVQNTAPRAVETGKRGAA